MTVAVFDQREQVYRTAEAHLASARDGLKVAEAERAHVEAQRRELTWRRGRIEVNSESFQTSVPNIYATGDVIGFPSLASTSMEQGRVAACHAFGVPLPPPPATFPYGSYAVPEISTGGLSRWAASCSPA